MFQSLLLNRDVGKTVYSIKMEEHLLCPFGFSLFMHLWEYFLGCMGQIFPYLVLLYPC